MTTAFYSFHFIIQKSSNNQQYKAYEREKVLNEE
jgi:hypothetical protein